jgi:hypothetical protein
MEKISSEELTVLQRESTEVNIQPQVQSVGVSSS